MNDARRKRLRRLIVGIESAVSKIDEVRNELEMIRDEESESYDRMPESARQDERRGQKSEAAILALDEVIDAMEFDALDLIDGIETACE